MSSLVVSQTTSLAKSLSIASDDPGALVAVLKATAFRGQVSDAQMTALLVVANQYGLNPWTKEIYAFPDKSNGIVPVVGVDGWSRIINSHPQFDGMDFEQDDDSCTCSIFRKDRSRPVRVTEYMAECRRPNVGPWQSHPRRMLRHKAMIQCARLAFGFVGIYEQDEAERIIEAESVVRTPPREVVTRQAPAVVDSPERDTLYASLQDIATAGLQAYGEAWGKLTKEQRTMIGQAAHELLKAQAEKASAEVVDTNGAS
ncbi:phage recombination protein Bet [Xanthomonas euvesicatoria]